MDAPVFPSSAPAAPRAQGATPLLGVNDVTLCYTTTEQIVTATWRVNFEIEAGDRFILLGPSGCGKSSLLKAVGGYMAPTEGHISLKGRQITRPGPDRMMVFQEFDQLLPWKTVKQNIMFPMVATVEEFDQGKALVEIELTHLRRHGHALPERVHIGAMLEVPSLLFQLDEMLERVDFLSVGSNDLMQFLYAADRGNTRVSERYDPLSAPVKRS